LTDYTPFKGRTDTAPPTLDLLETCWRFAGPSRGRVFSCGIYRTAAGLEVRAGHSPDDLIRSQFAIYGGA
jgi:hypothetical protein